MYLSHLLPTLCSVIGGHIIQASLMLEPTVCSSVLLFFWVKFPHIWIKGRTVMCQWAVCLCLRTSAVVSSCYCFRLTMNRLKLSSFTFEQVLVWECFTFPAVLGLGEKEPSMAKPMLRALGIWASVLSGRFSAGCGSAGVPNCRAWFSFIRLLFYHILQHLK